MATAVTWETLRELARFRAQKGVALSLYLGLDPSVAPTASDVDTRFKSLIDEAERTAASGERDLTHEQREGLKGDFDRVRRYFDEDFDRAGAHGLAVFAAGLDGFWAALPLADSAGDDARIGDEFYLASLVPLVGRSDGALVAFVSRERGDVYRLRHGRLVPVADLSEELPRRHDQGGWSQARFQRHVDEQAADHVRSVADELNRQARRLNGAPVVVVGTEEMTAEFEDLLAQETRSGFAGSASAEAHASPADLLEVAAPLLEEWRARRESELVERWREETGRNGRAAAGWGPTLEAASDGRIDVLLFQEGADREAWQCPACGRTANAEGACPLDGTPMERRDDGLDVAVHQTLAHGGTVVAITHHRELDDVEGIAALLRY